MVRRLTLVVLTALFTAPAVAQDGYSLEQIRSYPFPSGLTAAATGSRLAWAMNEQGRRNIYVAEGPQSVFTAAERALEVAWRSSPVSSVATWRSPVLIIHGDDDRNVRFSQGTDLVRRLARQGVPHETLVIVDDTHHWMRHVNVVAVGRATAEFLEKKLIRGGRDVSDGQAR